MVNAEHYEIFVSGIISRLRLYTIFLIHFDPIDIADVDKLSG